jgi:mono/diheme cytochrome c family protein
VSQEDVNVVPYIPAYSSEIGESIGVGISTAGASARITTVAYPRRILIVLIATGALALGKVDQTSAAAPPSEGPQVVSRAMTLLKENCLSCHNPEKKKGGLVLASREAALKGGENGAVLVPGSAKESRMAAAVLPEADPHMPPKGQLTADEIAAMRAWIDFGAQWDEKVLLASKPATTRPVTLRALPAIYHPVLAMALSPDQKRLAAGRGDRVLVFDISSEARPVVMELAMPPGDVLQSLAWEGKGKWLAAGGYRRVRIWDGQSGQLHRELGGLDGRVTAIAFSPDGQSLIAADGEVAAPGTVRIWRVEDARQVASWRAHDDSIFSIKISKDGKLLVSGGADRLVRLWDLADHKELAKFEGHNGAVSAVAIDPGAARIASAGTDKEIKIWDLKGKELKVSLTTSPAAVTDLAWVDATTVLSASEDGVARFSREDNKERAVATFSGAPDVLYCAAITADGKTVFAGCHDGFVYVWRSAGAKLEGKLPAAQPATAAPPTAKAQR